MVQRSVGTKQAREVVYHCDVNHSERRKLSHRQGVYTKTATKTCAHCKEEFTVCKGGLGAFRQRWCEACRGPKGTSNHLLKRYDLSWPEYQVLVARSAGKCEVCTTELKPLKDREARLVHVDHDHVTGIVRGIICHRCNQRLAALDDTDWMSKAQAYLQRGKQ